VSERVPLERIPVNLLTGFLGSGKTTLLKRLLDEPALAGCAVLINELGEIGLDHHLLGHVEHETVVLQNGCICCSVRDDLRQALLDLHERRERNLIPSFTRIMIESTGLADPAPVLNTIVADPVLRHHYRLGNVVATVDAVNALDQLAQQAESRKQAAIADRLVITKADLVDAAQLDAVRDALREINASAWMQVSRNDAADVDILLAEDLDHAATRTAEVRRWFPAALADARSPRYRPFGRPPQSAHRSDISTLSLTFDRPIDWVAFGIWLTMLLHSRGADILRVKGILHIQGTELPLVIHGVQQMIHPPLHLSAWPDDGDRRSRLVLIGQLPARELILASLRAFHVEV
jgi:G3E family GTPase